MKKLALSSIFVAFATLGSVPAVSQTTWEDPGDSDYRVGLWIGEQSEDARMVSQKLDEWSDESGGVLVRSAPVGGSKVVAEARAVEEFRDQGREAFFFDGAASARKYLKSGVAHRLDFTRRWMSRKGGSRALFEAGIFLVRAYLELDEVEEARRWMRRLVEGFPAHRPDRRQVPPEVVQMWEETAEWNDGSGAWLDLTRIPEASGECRVRLNGESIKEERIEVAPDRSYLLSRCDESVGGPTRWIRGEAGETRTVFWPDASTADDDVRKMVRSWGERADLDVVIYVGPGRCSDDETVCVAVDSGFRSERSLRLQNFNEALLDELVGW